MILLPVLLYLAAVAWGVLALNERQTAWDRAAMFQPLGSATSPYSGTQVRTHRGVRNATMGATQALYDWDVRKEAGDRPAGSGPIEGTSPWDARIQSG